MSIRCSTSGRAQRGPPGTHGSTQTEPSPGGTAGRSPFLQGDGSYDYDSAFRSTDGTDIGKHMHLPHLLMLLHEAEIAYLNERLDRALELIVWVIEITSIPFSPPPTRSGVLASLSVAGDGSAVNDVAQVNRRATVLLSQLSAGLNFYGFPDHYVPLVSLDLYGRFADELLDILANLEGAREKYFHAESGREAKGTALRVSIDAAAEEIGILEEAAEQGQVELRNAGVLIAELLGQILAMEVQLQQAEADFRAAVEREASCGFFDVIRAASALVSVGTNVWNAVSAIGPRLDEAQSKRKAAKKKAEEDGNPLKPLSDVDKIVQLVKAVEPSVDSIKAAYERIRPIIQDAKDRDKAKLYLAKENFREAIEPFIAMPEAQAFKALIEQYLGVIETRNEQILHADTIRGRIEADLARAEQRRLEVKRLRNDLALNENPELLGHVVFMRRAVGEVKRHLLRILYMEHRALVYWSVRDAEFAVTDHSAAHLETTHGRTRNRVVRRMEERNRPPQEFATTRPIVLRRSTHADAFRTFDNTGRLTFRISPSERAFRGRALVTVASFDLDVPGVRTDDGTLFARLVHHGQVVIRTRDGREMSFSHAPRISFFERDLRDGSVSAPGDLGGEEGTFAFLSPFGTWSLELDARDNPGLDISAIDEIRIRFSGFAFASFA